jgi:SAM-dependent methyltransferase
MTGNDYWRTIAQQDDASVREAILTGYLDGKPFTPYVPTIELPTPLTRVLDFGCGLGRNFPYLTAIARHVTGYDLPEMVDHCRAALPPDSTIALSADWQSVQSERFDLVFASLVIQHIEPAEARTYLESFAPMAPAVYLLTRGRNDFGGSNLELVDQARWEIRQSVLVQHDERTQRLEQIETLSPADASSIVDDRHVEMLLVRRGVDA